MDHGREVHVQTGEGKFGQTIAIGPHALKGDEPVAAGGADQGPMPFEYLGAALGTCTSMTVKMYSDRKGWKLTSVHVSVTQDEVDGALVFRRSISLTGDLSDEERTRLLEIANKCPVHKALSGTIRIESSLADPKLIP